MRRIGKLHTRVANLRADAIHQTTTELVSLTETLVVEDLSVKGMAARKPGAGRAGRGFNRAVADAALGEVSRQLGYKTGWYGTRLVEAHRHLPSSKTCASCARREPNLPLNVREWTCDGCGVVHHRDINAATNLAHLAVCTSCWEWTGDAERGRGATRKPCPAQQRATA